MNTAIAPDENNLDLPIIGNPNLPAIDSSSVGQFAASSRNIVPGLEVSLARRVLLPGSKRVLCMAAHTSVPLHEDEIASVSKLALRLSDGTSCMLDLQFFNDTTGNEFADSGNGSSNYSTYGSDFHEGYRPERYNPNASDSNLALFFTGILCVTVAACYSMTNNFNCGRWQSKPYHQYFMPSQSMIRAQTETKKPLANLAVVKSAAKASIRSISEKGYVKSSKVARSEVNAAISPVRAGLSTDKIKHNAPKSTETVRSNERRSGWLVPPPPPPPTVLSWPAGSPDSMANFSLAQPEPAAPTRRWAKTKGNAETESQNRGRSLKNIDQAPEEQLPLESDHVFSSTHPKAAPVPGDPANINLERIVLPSN
jgi:hypothetical protein